MSSFSYALTLMSCTSYDNSNSFHLDPWHKMQLGWSEPRIRSVHDIGVEAISAAQLSDPNAPVLLYNPACGNSEFFLLEYRTRTSPVGAGYDKNAAGNGLAIWHIKQEANHSPTPIPNDGGYLMVTG